MKREIRTLGDVALRDMGEPEAGGAAGDTSAAGKVIRGYAAVFNSPAEIWGCFIEKIAPGAFTAAIGRDDVRCLFNHDEDYVIGRTAAGTLRLAEDSKGLRYEADTPDTTWAKDLTVSIQRGDINQSSFAFAALREEWDETGDMPVRTILEVELYDVSPVTYPAYEDTECDARSAAQAVLVEARSGGLLKPRAPVFSPIALAHMRAALDLRARGIPTLSPLL